MLADKNRYGLERRLWTMKGSLAPVMRLWRARTVETACARPVPKTIMLVVSAVQNSATPALRSTVAEGFLV